MSTNAGQPLQARQEDGTDDEPADAPVILVVDDDRDIRESLAETLRDAGYRPRCVCNGEEAFSYLRRNAAPAAMLLDLFMPVMNGWQFVQTLRGTRYDSIPIIMVTGSEPYWGTPVARVLRKPLDLQEVVAAVAQVVSSDSGAAA
ncbi:MAG TPA: response regulator [Polyangia bacterium]